MKHFASLSLLTASGAAALSVTWAGENVTGVFHPLCEGSDAAGGAAFPFPGLTENDPMFRWKVLGIYDFVCTCTTPLDARYAREDVRICITAPHCDSGRYCDANIFANIDYGPTTAGNTSRTVMVPSPETHPFSSQLTSFGFNESGRLSIFEPHTVTPIPPYFFNTMIRYGPAAGFVASAHAWFGAGGVPDTGPAHMMVGVWFTHRSAYQRVSPRCREFVTVANVPISSVIATATATGRAPRCISLDKSYAVAGEASGSEDWTEICVLVADGDTGATIVQRLTAPGSDGRIIDIAHISAALVVAEIGAVIPPIKTRFPPCFAKDRFAHIAAGIEFSINPATESYVARIGPLAGGAAARKTTIASWRY
jgi:hypothetical protein